MKRALVVLAACSSPGSRCPDNTIALPGHMCTGPVIAIDGDFTDWDAVPAPDPMCPTCNPGEVATLRAVRSADDAIAVLIETSGAPITTSDHAYSLFLYNVRLPTTVVSLQVAPAADPIFAINNVSVDGLPSSFAFGATEIELAIPLAALPFAGAVTVGAQLDIYDGAHWQPGQDTLPFLTICWDPSSPGCAAI